MKIICIGRNYINHAKELNNPVPKEPVVFFKPDSAILRNNQSFYYPDFSNNIQHEIEVVFKINRLGKNISKNFANKYYNEVGIGIDFTARDIQEQCKKSGLPWEKAKSFDGSAPIGRFLPKSKIKNINKINFHLALNGKTVQSGNTKDMIFDIDDIISYVSQFYTLKIGDLIFTGTPAGVGPVKINDRLQCYLENELLLDFKVK
jgi:2-keto-4-pentenoate hydratase/2-oxohepta-3-ene-1,7-dioic acid hydratase in catechol pathway